MAAYNTPIPLKINCGYARTALRMLQISNRAEHRGVVHRGKLQTDFLKLFDIPTYQIPTSLKASTNGRLSEFDKNFEKICSLFVKKWNPAVKRVDYTNTFSVDNWKALEDSEKAKHTITKCEMCYTEHESLQTSFPGKPLYTPPSISVNLSQTHKGGFTKRQEKDFGRQVLQDLDTVWQKRFGDTIISSIPKILPEAKLTTKSTNGEKKKLDRHKKRTIVKEINSHYAQKATMSVLAEAESLSSYNRKRLALSFETPPHPKRPKSHSPNEDNLPVDTEKILDLVRNWPEETKINWSEAARTLGISQSNGGQIIKEIALKNGCNVDRLEQNESNTTPKFRRSKSKLSGGEISMPCLPTTESISAEKKKLIESGTLSIGEPCTPYKLTKTVVTNEGNIEIKEVAISGRKIPLIELRQQLLSSHAKYMRLTPKSHINEMAKEEIEHFMNKVHYPQPQQDDISLDTLRTRLHELQHTRTLALWHDHSTVLQTGYILFAVWVVYDEAVFLTEAEYKEKSGKSVANLQAFIEEPQVYMIAPSSSSPSDQIALIGDRLECLEELSTPCTAANEEKVYDHLRFFCGDKPAQQFERGTQIGGKYKCGGCGCKDHMMQDLSHALQRNTRSLSQLQTLVTNGKYGNRAGELKPLGSLKLADLKQELLVRGHTDIDSKLKPELQEKLTQILEGAQRVPTLLVLKPTRPLSDLNLSKYEILDCEPLHDIKGHLANILPEIPHLLLEPIKSECQQILDTTLTKASGAILRVAAIKLHLKLIRSKAPKYVIQLVETIVRISEILYMQDSKRCPKTVLRLYNLAWFHHELCRDLLPSPKTQSLTRLFGIYIHALVVHAPVQHHIISQLSVNAEGQERLFSQIKRISLRATNRKTENVLPTILLCIQARQKMEEYKPLATKQEGTVTQVSHKVSAYKGSKIDKDFVKTRLSSWQAHLQRISTFLEPGKNIWWKETKDTYHFFDSDTDASYRQEGPTLMHFRTSNLHDVELTSQKAWQQIVQSKTALPTPQIRLFNANGEYTGTRVVSQTSTNTQFPELTEEDYQNITTNADTFEQNTPDLPASFDPVPTDSSPKSSDVTDTAFLEVEEEVILNCSQTAPETQDSALLTKAANAIRRVTGLFQTLVEFDFLRQKLREYQSTDKRPSETQKEEYTDLLGTLHTTVISKLNQLKRDIKKCEQDYYNKYNGFPDINTPHYNQLRQSLHRIKTLLRCWHDFEL